MGGIAAVAEITENVPRGGYQICHAASQDIFFRLSSPVELITRVNILLTSPGICQIIQKEI